MKNLGILSLIAITLAFTSYPNISSAQSAISADDIPTDGTPGYRAILIGQHSTLGCGLYPGVCQAGLELTRMTANGTIYGVRHNPDAPTLPYTSFIRLRNTATGIVENQLTTSTQYCRMFGGNSNGHIAVLCPNVNGATELSVSGPRPDGSYTSSLAGPVVVNLAQSAYPVLISDSNQILYKTVNGIFLWSYTKSNPVQIQNNGVCTGNVFPSSFNGRGTFVGTCNNSGGQQISFKYMPGSGYTTLPMPADAIRQTVHSNLAPNQNYYLGRYSLNNGRSAFYLLDLVSSIFSLSEVQGTLGDNGVIAGYRNGQAAISVNGQTFNFIDLVSLPNQATISVVVGVASDGSALVQGSDERYYLLAVNN